MGSEKPADEDDILDYSVWLTVWEKEVEALSARVQRLASISRCPELVGVARQHSRKAEQVREAEPVSLVPDLVSPDEDSPDEDYLDYPETLADGREAISDPDALISDSYN